MPAQQAGSDGGPFVVRKATADDVDTVAAIWFTGWQDGHLGNVPAELAAQRREERFVPWARERLDGMWVGEAGGRVLGFVVVVDDEVEQVYVDRSARGSGLAAVLLRAAEAEVRRAGHRQAWLAVVAGNGRARAFYARLGWRDAGPLAYQAHTEVGPVEVPVRRYEVDLLAD
jgi:GNAT superfamily N-acetyltransferase